ncbi:MAG: hypothetical protein AB7O98_15285 [Hyphomonadaceae bacterium]
MAFEGQISDYTQAPPIAIETQPQRIIRQARERLAREGLWCRGAFQMGEAQCILGALRFFTSGNPDKAGTAGASRYVTRALRGRGFTSIQNFNDRYASREDVLAVLDRAYALAAKAA